MSHEVNNYSGITNGTLDDLEHKFCEQFDRYNDIMCKTVYTRCGYISFMDEFTSFLSSYVETGVQVNASQNQCMYLPIRM